MKFAIIFPGIGYHCDKPLLYYSSKLAAEFDYEIVKLNYSYDDGNIRGNEDKMKEAFTALYTQAEASLKDIVFNNYDDILFISKSVGTIIASAYATKHNIKCSHILYTPLEYTFDYPHKNACAFIGTSDPWSNVSEVIQKAKLQSVPIYDYAHLNHSLESANTITNIDTLADVMKKSKSFITAFT